MTSSGPVRSVPLDDVLVAAGATSGGQRWEAVGAGLGLAGTVLAVGVLVLMAVVHRGRRSEVQALLLLAMGGGALMFGGGVIEIAGAARLLEVGWIDALTDGSASSAMLRLLGGLLLLLGLGDETVPVGSSIADANGEEGGEPETCRWVPGASSAFGAAGAVLGVLSFAFDGHTVAEGPRVLHAAVGIVHVVAGGVWFGGVVGLAVVAGLRRRWAGSIGELSEPFSRLATLALGAVSVAGLGLALMVLDAPDQLTGTEWGRHLLVKVAAVGVAALLGAYRHLVVAPRVGDPAVERVARRTLTLEALVVTLVVVASALLTQSSII